MTKADRAMFEILSAQVSALTAKLYGQTPATPAPAPAPAAPAQASALPLWVQEVMRKADIPVPVPVPAVPVPVPEKKPEPPFATLAELIAYRAENRLPAFQTPDRPWTFAGYDVSGSDNLTIVFHAPQKNGGWFRSTLAVDLCDAIRKGKVIGMPVR